VSRLTLRPYQHAAIGAVRAAWAGGMRRPALVLPTGTGKTVVFAEIADQARREGWGRVLVVAHRKELIRQAAAEISALSGQRVGIVQATTNQTGAPFVVASMLTLATASRRAQIRDVGMVVVDEAHHAVAPTYLDILEHYGVIDGPKYGRSDGKRAVGLGVTATMSRGDGGALGAVWDEVVYEYPLTAAIRDGALVEPRGIVVDVEGLNLDAVKRSGGDWQDKALGEALSDSVAPERIVEAWLTHAAGRPTVLFAPSVDFARIMMTAFQAAGVTADIVHGDQADAERDAVWERVKSGETLVTCNCMVATEGTNIPRWSCAIIGRLTGHAGLYMQMVGRVLRTYPGKRDALVLDVVGVSRRHKLAVLADLIGLEDEAAQTDPDVEVVEGELIEATEDEGAAGAIPIQYRDGRPVYEEIDLFHGSRLVWMQTHAGVWFLPVGNRFIALMPALSRQWDEWDVVSVESWHGGAAGLIEQSIPGLGLAQAFGEGAVTAAEAEVAARDARFRGKHSNVTVARLRRAGLGRDATRGQLMEAETRVHASARIDPMLAWVGAR